MRKSFKAIVSIACSVIAILLCCSLFACGNPNDMGDNGDEQQNLPDNPVVTSISFENWDSAFTEEQHIVNIENRAEELLKNELSVWNSSPLGALSEYQVYILYSFDNTPRFFMVEWFSKDFLGTKSFAFSQMGFIYQDEYYYFGAKSESDIYYFRDAFGDERSPYRKENALAYKMYFSEHCKAYLDGEEIICIEASTFEGYPTKGQNMTKEQIDLVTMKDYYLTYNIMLKYKTKG